MSELSYPFSRRRGIGSNPRKRKSDVLDTSKKALGGMIVKVVVEEVHEG